MTAQTPAPHPTAAHPLTPPPTTAGATWPMSHPYCWTPPPQALLPSQRRTLQESTKDTTVFYLFFPSNPCLFYWVDCKNRYSITRSCIVDLYLVLVFVLFFYLHTLCHCVCLNQNWCLFTSFLNKSLF